MTKRKKRLLIFLAAFALLTVALVPFPASVDDSVKNRVVSHALNAVIQNDRVLSDGGYGQLYDCDSVRNGPTLFRKQTWHS